MVLAHNRALGRLRQKDHEFSANQGYIASSRPFGIHRLSEKQTNKKMTVLIHTALLQGVVYDIPITWAEVLMISYLNKL